MCSMTRIVSGADATILHADLDSFYASVEQRDDPSLRGRPIIVGGGIVLAASYEAKRMGVYTPMPEFQARRVCPDVVVVPPRFDAYIEASKAVFEVFDDTSPIVEGLSIDEAFLDVSGLWRIAGTPAEIAARAAGGGTAQGSGWRSPSASHARSSSPRSPAGLPSPTGCWSSNPIVRSSSCIRCRRAVVGRRADHRTQTSRSRHLHGRRGRRPERRAPGGDAGYRFGQTSPRRSPTTVIRGAVETGKRRGSIGSQQALGRGHKSPETIEALLLGIVDRVTRRMRTAGRVGRTVTVRMRFDDFTRATRSRSLPHPTAATEPIRDLALAVLRDAADMIEQRGLTLIGLSVGNLRNAGDHTEQLLLPFGRKDRSGLDEIVDGLRDRFGHAALTRASLLGRRTGFEVPKLPD